jgi:hypothetical protein
MISCPLVGLDPEYGGGKFLRNGCETWTMTVTNQNRLLVFERRVLRKIYGPSQDNDGAWRIKTNEESENRIKKKNIVRFIKSRCRLRWAAHVMEWIQQELSTVN